MRLLRALGLTLVLLAGGACGGEPAGGPATDVRAPSEAVAGAWARLPDLPLSPRRGPVVATVDDRVVVVGGYTGVPCPPTADCVFDTVLARDGVVLTDDGTWEPIAEAPVPVPEYTSHAVLPEGLFVLADGEVLRWSSDEDAWSRIPTPRGQQHGTLVAHDGRLHLVQGSDEQGERPDFVLTRAGAWEPLPDDPFDASFDRAMVSTPHGLVLTRLSIERLESGDGPVLVEAAVLRDGRWRELGPSDQLGGARWTWAGERLVDATLGGADGGEVNGFGRVIPFGGRLDPATGRWSRLPDTPEELSGGWQVEAYAGPVVASSGYLYDDTDGSWARLPVPRGAPPTPGPATWLDDAVVVVGGEDWRGVSGRAEATDVWSGGVWLWKVG